MTSKQIKLIVTIEIESDDAQVIAVTLADPQTELQLKPATTDEGVPSSIESLIDEIAPPNVAEFQREFASRCIEELKLDLRRPSGPRKYINGFPPKKYGSKRAVSLAIKSSRAEIYCDPSNARNRKNAAQVLNNGEPFAVKVYLTSSEAVNEAIELTKIGLEERQ